jgi:replicative DNA helicase
VAEGGRDDTCTRLAGYLLGKGIPQDAVELILQAWAEKCSPPFPSDQVSKCVESIAKREGVPDGPPHSLAEALDRVLHDIEHPQARSVAKTEFDALDAKLDGGLEPGLIYMGARPGVGKSALALHIGRKVAVTQGVLYVSREMSVGSLVRRMLSQASSGGLPISDLKTGEMHDIQKKSIPLIAAKLRTLSMWLTTDIATTAQLEAALLTYSPGTLGLVVVDYLQLMKPVEFARDSRARVEAVSEELKRLSVKFNLPFLVLSSLRRPERATANWRPSLSDLRESGELEHDADVVLLLHRDLGSDVLEINLAKQRDGEVGRTTLAFHGPTVSFK